MNISRRNLLQFTAVGLAAPVIVKSVMPVSSKLILPVDRLPERPLIAGELRFSASENKFYVFDGTKWDDCINKADIAKFMPRKTSSGVYLPPPGEARDYVKEFASITSPAVFLPPVISTGYS